MGCGGKHYKSIYEVESFIEKANFVGEKAAQNGMKFTYHNHGHEFYKWDNGKTTMDMMVDRQRIPDGGSAR